jgi:hypothetical protein
VLRAGVARFPTEPTLARRLCDVLRVLDLQDQGEALVDALGSLAEVTTSTEERANLLWEMGRLFEEESGRTSAAIDLFHEALAWRCRTTARRCARWGASTTASTTGSASRSCLRRSSRRRTRPRTPGGATSNWLKSMKIS